MKLKSINEAATEIYLRIIY